MAMLCISISAMALPVFITHSHAIVKHTIVQQSRGFANIVHTWENKMTHFTCRSLFILQLFPKATKKG